jgi:3-oxoacyl-(acyl-carrier-protein) synthase
MGKPATSITGMGLVSCFGLGVDPAFQAMCAGACGIREIDRFDPEPYARKTGGQLPAEAEEALRDEFPEDDFAVAMIKAAGREALTQAGRTVGEPDPELGLVLATNFGPMETLEWCWRERLDMGTMDDDTFAMVDGAIDAVADWLGCAGPRLQLSLSCASGAATVAVARDLIRSGRARRVLAIGYDALTEYCWCGLTNLRTITTDMVRPFDANRSGTVFSEGAAALLVSHADDGPGLATLAGAATNNNAFHMTAPAKEADGSRRVMQAALDDAGMSPAEIEHVCAHATSTSANDVTEAACLRNLFGERLPLMTVAAHKSQLGHMMGGAGAAEAIITIRAMREGIIPPTINHITPDPECLLDCVPGTARRRQFRTAITNSAGIGGNNSSLVLALPTDA